MLYYIQHSGVWQDWIEKMESSVLVGLENEQEQYLTGLLTLRDASQDLAKPS
jgi:hypothetical protein